MELDKRIVKPGKDGYLIGEQGEILVPPSSWAFLPAGDAAVTRKVTAKGVFWRVEVKVGRRQISQGIWAPSKTIALSLEEVKQIHSTDEYKKKRQSDRSRRDKKQQQYEAEFRTAVEDFLNFNLIYKSYEQKFAKAVTRHAIPVGSGTVARTQSIPIEERAAHAVIAWMRHQTTAYDQLKIAKIKGERRAIRRTYAKQSVDLLLDYRQGRGISDNCPLLSALNKIQPDDE